MIEGSGSIPLTGGSGSGSRRPKNKWIRRIRIRIRIRNTGYRISNPDKIISGKWVWLTLSVWMSQSSSPAPTVSPSALYHLTMVPSLMVGERLGMLMVVPGTEPPPPPLGGVGAAAAAAEEKRRLCDRMSRKKWANDVCDVGCGVWGSQKKLYSDKTSEKRYRNVSRLFQLPYFLHPLLVPYPIILSLKNRFFLKELCKTLGRTSRPLVNSFFIHRRKLTFKKRVSDLIRIQLG